MHQELILNIINKYESEYFTGSEAANTKAYIQSQIEKFKISHCGLEKNILETLIGCYANVKVENWTQLYLDDRCLRYLIEFNEDDRFILQISIYGFISIYKHPCKIVNGDHIYGIVEFFDEGESAIADDIVSCVRSHVETFVRFDKKLFSQKIDEFSMEGESLSDLLMEAIGDDPFTITVGDVLFTKNRL